MNLVALLVAPAVVMWGYGETEQPVLRVVVAIVAALVVVGAVVFSKRKPIAVSAGQDANDEAAKEPARTS